MENLVKNKLFLVAGAGGLLGSKLVSALLSQNAKVIAADINIDGMVERLKKIDIDINNSNIIFSELDITNEISVKNLFSQYQQLDGAINTTYPRNKNYGKHFFDVTLESFNENLSLHLGSAFLFTQQCASYFQKTKRSFSLVNISSIYGMVAPKFDIYNNTTMTMPVE
ncbi:SDR family oxidoreductase, partial [Providencia hangzhouensis]